MFSKKIKSLIAPIAILGAFTLLATGSSSTSSISEKDAYDAGYKIGEGLHHLLNDANGSQKHIDYDAPKDSIKTNQLVCYN